MATVGGRQQDEQSINFHAVNRFTDTSTHGVTLYYMNTDDDKIDIYIYIYIYIIHENASTLG